MDELRLKLAVQKSGRLTEPSLDMLPRCGLKLSRGKDQLMGFGENMPLDVLPSPQWLRSPADVEERGRTTRRSNQTSAPLPDSNHLI